MPDLARHLGDALLVSRHLRGLSQEELGRRSGIMANQISRYETGAVLPQIPQLERLLEGLGTGYVEFFYVLSAVKRLHRLLAGGTRDSPEALTVEAALVRLAENVDAHARLAEEIEALARERLGQEKTP